MNPYRLICSISPEETSDIIYLKVCARIVIIENSKTLTVTVTVKKLRNFQLATLIFFTAQIYQCIEKY